MDTLRLLLVDDEQDFLTYTSRRFSRRNVEVKTAQSGQEALDMVSAGGFDVVVLDVRMPGMDGLAVLKKIRKVSPETQVILLTGHASSEAAVRGMMLGAFEYMLKPVQFDELYFKVMEAVRTAGAL